MKQGVKRNSYMKLSVFSNLVKLFLKNHNSEFTTLTEKEVKQVLKIFRKFLREKKISLNELYSLDDLDIIEYYLLLKEKVSDREQEITMHVRIVFDFIKFINELGLLDNNSYNCIEQKAYWWTECFNA